MKIKKVEFTDFRNVESEEISFSDGINVIWGENAQGKTNIVEGIYLFARGKGFRAAKDKELIRFGKDISYVKLFFEKGGDDTEMGAEIQKTSKKIFYKNRVRAERISDIIGDFRAVLFCPSHLGIINDSPSVRRRFLDVAISQLKPVYIKMLSRYNTVMEQRNAILKMSPEARENYKDMLGVYSSQLASLCADIALMRYEYVKKLDVWVKKFFSEMTFGSEEPKIKYESDGWREGITKETAEKKYLSLLTENVDKEIKYGATLYGIHKDDLETDLNGKDARYYASQGQTRSFALAMKLAEGEISREETGEYPVFLLDDVLSELDRSRKKYILSNIKDRQVIITCCERSLFCASKDVFFVNIEGGRVKYPRRRKTPQKTASEKAQ